MFDFAPANTRTQVNLSILRMGLDPATVLVCRFAGLIVLFLLPWVRA